MCYLNNTGCDCVGCLVTGRIFMCLSHIWQQLQTLSPQVGGMRGGQIVLMLKEMVMFHNINHVRLSVSEGGLLE